MSSKENILPATKSKAMTASKVYHHGALRESLLAEGMLLLQEVGIEDISLRQLADRVGVTAAALYHHFKNKQELLYALGSLCLARFEAATFAVLESERSPQSEGAARPALLERMVVAYVRFAIENPEFYELLFGRQIWHVAERSDFHRQAKQSFRKLNEHLLLMRFDRPLRQDLNPLRVAQVGWATVHGLCRMYNDGLAFKAEDIEDIARHASQLIERALFVADDE